MKSSIAFLPVVDCLRAIAVLAVTLYHFQIEIFASGYFGVDVFFVISGFLIGKQLIKSDNTLKSTIEFVVRRAFRVLPMLFATTLLIVFCSYFIFLVEDFVLVGQSLKQTFLFNNNNYFWKLGDGYFSPSIELNPVLHFWSIAVEIQFYVFISIFFSLFKPFGKWRKYFLIFGGIFSFILANYGSLYGSGQGSFFLFPTRFWEFCVGILIADITVKKAPKPDFICLFSFILLLVSFSLFDKYTPNPSVFTLIPVLTSAILILLIPQSSWMEVPFRNSLALLIGRISYSIYLLHFPIAASLIYVFGNIGYSNFILAIFFIFIASIITEKYVERPFRKIDCKKRATLVLVLLGIGSWGLNHQISLGTIQPLNDISISKLNSNQSSNNRCASGSTKVIKPENACVTGDKNNVIGAFIGDSHANQMALSFSQHFTDKNIGFKVFAFAGCPPVIGVKREDANSDCTTYFKDVLTYLDSNRNIKNVFVSARHPFYFNNSRFDNGEGGVEYGAKPKYSLNAQVFSDEANWKEEYLFNFAKTLSEFSENDRVVTVILPIPEIGYDVPSRLARSIAFGKIERPVTVSYQTYLDRNEHLIDYIVGLNYPTINVSELFCDTIEKRCFASEGGQALYQDDDHLNDTGAEKMLNQIEQKLNLIF